MPVSVCCVRKDTCSQARSRLRATITLCTQCGQRAEGALRLQLPRSAHDKGVALLGGLVPSHTRWDHAADAAAAAAAAPHHVPVPMALISAQSEARRSSRRPETTMRVALHPRDAYSRAVARPMPDVAPVMKMFLAAIAEERENVCVCARVWSVCVCVCGLCVRVTC